MWIYKITNKENGKIYIGQSIRPIEFRFRRHINDALRGKLDTHFARAIRKYGADSFYIEEIDTAITQDELNHKEQFWIQHYNSTVFGYNETDALYKCGGNTYKNKTEEEMVKISKKISIANTGKTNGMARKINRINVLTGEIDTFDTIISCAKACVINSGKTSIMERLSGNISRPFKNKWLFEYYTQ